MIVYREQRSTIPTRDLLVAASASADALTTARPAHDLVVQCLIDVGVLEAAVADALFPETDSRTPATDALRQANLAAGHLLWHSWRGTWDSGTAWISQLDEALEQAQRLPLPPDVEAAVPEGFSHYGVYPETYLEAIRRNDSAVRGRRIVCIGIRSIGTSLSGAVAAACEELGAEIVSFTVRPRGHPFDRQVTLSDALQKLVCHATGCTALVVDEGPGISGSSFAGTARALNALGVRDDDIVFLPSWRADGGTLRSDAARARWPRHRRWTVDFEELWPPGDAQDLAAGKWRSLVYTSEARYPAVHPQHERRKFLEPDRRLRRFVGLGRYGHTKFERAERLAGAGFSPPPLRIQHGFLEHEWINGTPVSDERSRAPGLLDSTARYLAHLCRAYPATPTVSNSTIDEMIRVNVAKGLGDPWTTALDRHLRSLPSAPVERATALDGRMLSHEWLETPAGYRKIDSLDHHDDHFFPGCQDIAWDVASAAVELGLDATQREELVTRYTRASGDHTIGRRLPYYTLAYLAFRLGYATLAAETLAPAPDGARFARLARQYRARIEAALACSSAGSV